jgi:vitamin B12 transporter
MRWKSTLQAAFAALSSAICLAIPVKAQEATELPPLTVQGATLEGQRTRTPARPASQTQAAPAAASETPPAVPADTVLGVPADTIGNAVTVITGDDLRRQQVHTAAEALRGLPGVSVGHSGGIAGFTQVRIRGAEGNHTLVLIDGIVANNTGDGEFDFSNLAADEIDRIEIIRGPMSGLYGSNAVGGVVNVITRRGNGPLSASIQTEIGSLATKNYIGRISGGSDKANLSVAYQWRDTNGFNISPVGSEDDGSRLSTFSLRAGAKVWENATLDVVLRRVDNRGDRDGFGDFLAPAGSLAQSYDDGSIFSNRILMAGANLKWDTFGGALTHEFRANHNGTIVTDQDASFGSSAKNTSDVNSFAYAATYRFDTGPWVKHSLSALVQNDDERFTPAGTFADGLERERGRMAFAGEWRGGFGDRLFLTANIRRDDNDSFQDFTTWHAAASLKLPELALRPHASVGTAVKLPTMFEQFGTSQFFVPNPALSPEESFGWDAGLEFTLLKGRATLDITYFHADLTDRINGTAPGPLPGTLTAINLPGQSLRQGVEIGTRYKLASNLILGGAYTYTNARNPDGLEEVRRPPHSVRADLTYTWAEGRGSLRLAANYNGTMQDVAFVLPNFFPQPRVDLAPYWLVNAAVSYKLQPGVELFGRVENLLDQHYQEVFGFDAAPITAFAGVKFTFGGVDGLGGHWTK